MLRKVTAPVDEDPPRRQLSIQMLQPITEDKCSASTLAARRQSVAPALQATRKMSIAPQGHPIVSNTPRKSIAPIKGPSLIGLLATRKFAKQLMSRHRMSSYGDESSKLSSNVKHEPTYRMEPHRKFENKKVRA